jgi:hypothetical protein
MYDAQTDDPVTIYAAPRMINLLRKNWHLEQTIKDAPESSSPADLARMALEEAERARPALKETFIRFDRWAAWASRLQAAMHRHDRPYLTYTIIASPLHESLGHNSPEGENSVTAIEREELVQSATSESQLKLRMEETFTPSAALTQYWLNGLRAFSSSAQFIPAELLGAIKQSEIAQEFAKMLTATFGTIGQQLRYDEKPQRAITNAGRFAIAFQLALSDRFLIIPDEAGMFFELLSRELISALWAGTKLQGAWGRVMVNTNGDLQYQLAKPNFVRDPSFVESEDVE